MNVKDLSTSQVIKLSMFSSILLTFLTENLKLSLLSEMEDVEDYLLEQQHLTITYNSGNKVVLNFRKQDDFASHILLDVNIIVHPKIQKRDLDLSIKQHCPRANDGPLGKQKTLSPNINTSTINTKLMMKNNNTMEWLGGKNEEDKIQIMAKARQESQILKEKEISDEIKLNNERRATLQQRIDEKEAKCIKINQERKELLNEIDKMGGKWKSEPEMTSYIDNLKFKKDKISAIKNQIMYRKDVCMQSVTDKSLFRRNLDINSLKQNLINLIQLENTQNVPVPMEINENDNKHSHEQDIPPCFHCLRFLSARNK
ncbi:unnamed protein product [Mytilus edulis]|uniref:Uncharacterized protein n=1 Tax=Mytilus edulis TaxID=6550 RepID=A0A8S3Q0E0_MYTED|nr:unnamed protein product [Mytilus edulis]